MADASLAGTVYGHVYCITNSVNGKQYVGQTTRSIQDRWRQHKAKILRSVLSSAIQKYGAVNFTCTCLSSAQSQEDLDQLECEWISKLQTIAPSGYNMSGGGFGAGRMIEETKNKIRKAQAEYQKSDEFRKKHKEIMREISARPEIRAARSKQAADSFKSEDHRRRHSEAVRAAMNSPDVVDKLSKARRTLWEDPEYRRRHEAFNRTPEAKRLLSERSKEMWRQDGFRDKTSKAISAAIAGSTDIMATLAKKRFESPEFRLLHSQRCREAWARPGAKEKRGAAMSDGWARRKGGV